MRIRELRSEPPPGAVDYLAVTRRTYDALGYPPYQWAHEAEPVPLHHPTPPLRECRVAIVASGGVYRTGQIAFHHRDDDSYRLIDADAPADELRTSHFAYDQTDARADIGCVYPAAALARLAAEGTIGSVASAHLTFMGGIYSTRRVRETLAPAILEHLVADGVDIALLVPV